MRSLALAYVLVLIGCPSSLRRGAADVLMPPDQEAALGKQVEAEVRAKTRLLRDETVQAYVRSMGARLVALDRARIEKPIEPHFTVLDDPQVNAFAIPGGGIYVMTGLIAAAHDEAELAGVLAHELGHVVKRHVAQGMATQFGLEMLTGIALGNNPSALAQIGAAVAQNGYLLKYSRSDEAEADRVGMETILASRYWNPHGLISMMETFRKKEGEPGFLALLQSHPSPADRIENLTRQWQAAGSPGGEDGVAPFAAIQARLPRRERPRSNSDLSR